MERRLAPEDIHTTKRPRPRGEKEVVVFPSLDNKRRFYAWIVQPLPNAPTALWKVKPGAFGVLARLTGGRAETPSYEGIEAFDTCSLSMLGLGNFSKQNNLHMDVKKTEGALGERSRVAAALFNKVSKNANTLPPYKIAYITRTPMLLTSLLAVSDSKAAIHFEVYVCAKSPARIEGLKVERTETISRHLFETPEMEESELDSVVEPGFTVTRLTGSLEPDQLKGNLAISLDFLPVERR